MAGSGRRRERRRGSNGNYRQRSSDKQETLQRFLILCEGERTEPNYLRMFRGPSSVVDVKGFGVSPAKIVDVAVDLKGQDEYEQVWCVFDRDDHSVGEFNAAVQRAQSQGVRVAYSNQAFELWYLLHFHFYNTPMPRASYSDKLNELLPRPYRKNELQMYDLLLAKQSTAVRNAERLLKQYSPPNPGKDDPSTTVHLLVQELNRGLPERR